MDNATQSGGPTEGPIENNSTVGVGLIGIALVLAITILCIAPFEHHFFTEWVGLAFIAATPAQVVLGLLWHNSKPDFVGNMAQPMKGLALTAITVVTGAIILFIMLSTVGAGHGSTPMLVQYAIMTVVTMIWVVPLWQTWPFSLFTKNPLILGLLSLLAAYLSAYILWQVFFDFGVLGQAGHPHYHADMDPGGMFPMWAALVFFVTTAGVIISHMLFDFWPIEKLSGGTGQPVRGLIGSIYILAVSFAVQSFFVDFVGMERVDYMIRVPVSMIFGTFLVNNMMQHRLFSKLAQPGRGVALICLAAMVAMFMHMLYAFASGLHAGEALGTGPQAGYAREIWIASAMLGVTFPIVFMVSGFFGFWPIKRNGNADD